MGVESAESWSRPLQIQDTGVITPNLCQRLQPPTGSKPPYRPGKSDFELAAAEPLGKLSSSLAETTGDEGGRTTFPWERQEHSNPHREACRETEALGFCSRCPQGASELHIPRCIAPSQRYPSVGRSSSWEMESKLP